MRRKGVESEKVCQNTLISFRLRSLTHGPGEISDLLFFTNFEVQDPFLDSSIIQHFIWD